ncbi:hypothetical protein HMPREF2960_05385 [Corynebacterium sp. HMSC070B05]|nr:hypothetical protein HMPREF2960_05385 [Corynebacterium sp. HMSC070B05]OHR38089.1 hypothetical protein HMPREF2920_04715 [Corynebacterium sp. HMSC075F02]
MNLIIVLQEQFLFRMPNGHIRKAGSVADGNQNSRFAAVVLVLGCLIEGLGGRESSIMLFDLAGDSTALGLQRLSIGCQLGQG